MIEELKRWKEIAAYLAKCNAATCESMPKSWAKSQQDRFKSIARKSADYLEGIDHPYSPTPEETDIQVRNAIARCRKALQ